MEAQAKQPTESSEDGKNTFEMDNALADEKLLVNGVERFETFLKNQKNEAILMIKKWINADSELENLALRGIVQLLNNDDLIIEIMKLISQIFPYFWLRQKKIIF